MLKCLSIGQADVVFDGFLAIVAPVGALNDDRRKCAAPYDGSRAARSEGMSTLPGSVSDAHSPCEKAIFLPRRIPRAAPSPSFEATRSNVLVALTRIGILSERFQP